MEAVLRSVLLRREQMEMQWDAEFEQQKQLFHINTSTLIDMLPIQPRKKRLRLEGSRAQGGLVPSHDKENLNELQGTALKSPKTKAPPSRGLAKRDLNTRFCDNDVKDAGRMATKPAETQPSLRNCLDAERLLQNASIVHAVKPTTQGSVGVSVKVEVDEDNVPQVHVSLPTDESPTATGENRKRVRGEQEENIGLQNRIEQNIELPNDDREQTTQAAVVDPAEKNTKLKRARKGAKARECAVEAEVQDVARCNDPEIVCKVQVEADVLISRDAEFMKPIETEIVSKVIDPEIVSKAPSRRGRPKGATAASQAPGKAAVPDVVSKEPARRGRVKQISVPQVAQRVTRSRARMVVSVVEPEAEVCEKVPIPKVVNEESAQQVVSLEPLCEAEVLDRSSNQTVTTQNEACYKPESALPKEISPDEPTFKKSSDYKGQKSVTHLAQNDSENFSVANGLAKRGPSHVQSPEEVIPSRMNSGEKDVRISSRLAEILASVRKADVDHLKDGQHRSQLQSQPLLEMVEKGLGHREVAFVPAETPLAITHEETELLDGSSPSALVDATIDKEETAKSAQCEAAPGNDTLVEEVIEDMTKEGSPIGEESQACASDGPHKSTARLSPCEAANQLLRKAPTVISNVTSTSEVSKTALRNSKEAYTTLLSEVIEGSFPLVKKSGHPVQPRESLRMTRSHKFSLQSERMPSVTVPLELSEARNDASTSEVILLPTAGESRKSTVAEISEAGMDVSGEQFVGVSNMLASERQGSEIDNEMDDDNIEANEERSRHSVQDAVMNTLSEVSHMKQPGNVGNPTDEASRMDMTREQVKSDAISPVRYSEARAIEEAIRCSLEQEFHPDVTLTLNRWQFRKRLSPRSKARARRWRSDVATNGVDCGRGQSSDAPVASPSRIVSSRERSLEGVAYETFLEAQTPDVAAQGCEPSFSLGAGKAAGQADTSAQQELASESARRSISSLFDEVLSQALKEGDIGDHTVEYEIMETADEKGNLSPLPLLQSIYTLSKACQDDMVGARGFLEEGEQQPVHSLIESARKIMDHLSSKRFQAVGAPPTTPASNYPAPSNSRFHSHTNLYPDRFRLFITPRAAPGAPSVEPPASAAPEVASVLPGDIESTSLERNHLVQETIEQAGSRAPYLDSDSAENVASPAHSLPPSGGKLLMTSDTANDSLLREGANALMCSPAVGSVVDTDALPNTIVRGTSMILPDSQNVRSFQPCGGSIERTGDLPCAVELMTHQSEGVLGLETSAETEKLSELRSRFYALSKDCVGASSTAKDVPSLLGDGAESLISHFTNPPSPTPYLRFSPGFASKQPKGARLSIKKTLRSSKDIHVDSEEIEEPAAAGLERETRIPCSPIFIGDRREGVEEPAEEPMAPPESTVIAGSISMLRVEPQCSSNLISDVPNVPLSNPKPPRSNLVTNMRSFVPLVQQQQPAAPYPNGKRDVKVKALEAAEAAKRLAEQKELEKQERKKAAELAKREKQERAAQEKLAKREKAAQEKLKQQEARAERENEEANKKKGAAAAAAAGPTKSVMADSTNCQGANGGQNVFLKVKKTHELKLKMDQEKQERLLEEQRRKEEEWKKKEAENAARKRKHEAAEKKEREEKRRRQEEAMKAHRENEERQRLELEKRNQRQRAMEEMERERKALEDELKRQTRLAKEKEVEQRRKKEEEKELAWLEMKDATRKRKEEAAKQLKLLETEVRQQTSKIRRPSEDPAIPSTGPYHSFMASLHVAIGIQGEGVAGRHLSGVNSGVVDPHRVSSQSLVGHPLRVPHHSAEGATGAMRNSQAALRVLRTTPESIPGVSTNAVPSNGSGKPLFRTPPEAVGGNSTAAAAHSAGGSTAKELRDRINVLQGQSGSRTGASGVLVVGVSKPCQPGQVGFAGPPGGVVGQAFQSYEISPFRDSEDEDSEEEEKRSQKPIPQWARKENMLPQLVRQLDMDPDDIFVGASSCSLDEVFEVKGSKKRPDFKRRGSSGDWAKDRLTWQEQIQYKAAMGYLQ